MASPRRKFSTEQKMQILQQAEQSGVIKVIRQHKLSYSVFSRWKQQLAAVLSFQYQDTMLVKKEKERLELENDRLKKIIANQALELELMNENLKKEHNNINLR